ncbi:DUF4145 domain-containing protein [Paenibacillus sp. 11B]|uniref:DUF4145 domain-containing protein n=1 Tax=unclassified Paenibacillus TaxID=185978 RepID=UPI00264B197C|nr:DUF4145 domain-containing protein [Paenibacillus sp. 11B]MDN8592038.1 DUF4145 domain-containing protein [Paenibacillus sp. 11B]
MKTTYFPPLFKAEKFSCPHCEVYTTQSWDDMFYGDRKNTFDLTVFFQCTCYSCNRASYWYKENMIIPLQSSAPLPHEDLPSTLLDDYEEARSIVHLSPRGAVALLRLVLEKLLAELLGEQSNGINNDIKSLVRNGLPVRVEKALDIIRVVGNNAVHPGRLDLKDDQQTALTLFELINIIIENQITLPRTLDTLEDQFISEGQRQIINERQRPVSLEP